MIAATADCQTETAELVREHQADAWRYLRFLGCDPAEAEDLVQETFLEIIRRPFEQRSRNETAAYLRRVARSQMLMLRRSQRRDPVVANLDRAERVWSAATDNGSLGPYLDALGDCLQSAINDRQRAAIDLRYRDGRSREEIARSLDMTIDGIKTMLRRARSALRDCIQGKLKHERTT